MQGNKYDKKPNGKKSNVVELSASDFKDNKIINKNLKNKLGILKVYAPWCGYCTQMVSDVNFIADELKSVDFKVAALNFDNAKDVSRQLSVSSLPAMFMIDKKGNLENISSEVGDRSIEKILDVVCKKSSEYGHKGYCIRTKK